MAKTGWGWAAWGCAMSRGIAWDAQRHLRGYLGLGARGSARRAAGPSALSRYMRNYFFQTDGWFHEVSAALWDCLLAFQSQMHLRGNLLEIGVWKGRSAILQAMHAAADEQLVLVDISIQETMRRTIGGIKPSAVQYLQMRSSDLPTTQLYREGSRSYRWVHIDGEHTGTALTIDLDIANHLLDAEGIVAIDDFMLPVYPQVTRMTFDYLSQHENDLHMFICGINKAYLCRPEMAPTYLSFVKESLYAEMRSRGYGNITICKTAHPNDMNCFGICPYRQDGLDYRGPDGDRQSIRI